jgi:hypothetical protein
VAGSKTNERVKWAKQLTEPAAKAITLQGVLSGSDNWSPKTGTSSFTNMNEAAQAPIVLWPNGAPGAVGKDPVDVPTLIPFLPLKIKRPVRQSSFAREAVTVTWPTMKVRRWRNGLTRSASRPSS